MKKRKNSCLLLAVITLSIFSSDKNALGFYFEADPEFSWQLYYEDNISGSGNNDLEDFSNRYEPSLDFSINSSWVAITGKSEINIIEYMDEKSWNVVDQDHRINAFFVLSQRTGVNISAGYTVKSDPDSYLTQEDALIGGEAFYTVKRHKNKTKFFSANYNYSFSARSNLSSSFIFSNFETGVTDGSDYYTFGLNYEYSLSKTTSLLLNADYNFFDFSSGAEATRDRDFLEDIVAGEAFELFVDSDYEMDNYNIYCTLKHMFSKGLNLNFSFGWRYTEIDISSETIDLETGETISESDKGSGSGGTFSLLLQKDFSYTRLSFKADQNIGTNPNTGATYERRRFRISASHDFTHRLSGKISLSYYMQETDNNDEFGYEIDRDTYYINPIINYRYNDWLTVALSYRWVRNKNNIRNNEYERNTFFLHLNFKLLRPYISR